MRIRLSTSVDKHDYEQLRLLATVHKLKIHEVLARIIKAYLDKRSGDPLDDAKQGS